MQIKLLQFTGSRKPAVSQLEIDSKPLLSAADKHQMMNMVEGKY